MSSLDSKANAVVVSVPSEGSVPSEVSPKTPAEFLQLMKDVLSSPPTTSAEAVALYKMLSEKLAHYLVNSLPTLEAKAAALTLLVVKEVAAVTCLRC